MPGTDISETTDPGNNANYKNVSYAIGNPYYRTVAGEFELSESPYGTFDQGGNVWEWTESAVSSSAVRLRGGSFQADSSNLKASFLFSNDPANEYFHVGFRVATPEPTSIALCLAGVVMFALTGHRR